MKLEPSSSAFPKLEESRKSWNQTKAKNYTSPSTTFFLENTEPPPKNHHRLSQNQNQNQNHPSPSANPKLEAEKFKNHWPPVSPILLILIGSHWVKAFLDFIWHLNQTEVWFLVKSIKSTVQSDFKNIRYEHNMIYAN